MAKAQKRNSGNREIPVEAVIEVSAAVDELHHRRIAEKAHELYQCRGCCHGRDLDDWLEAERLILSEVTTPKSGTPQNPRPREPRAIRR
jgi:hypothetical protein